MFLWPIDRVFQGELRSQPARRIYRLLHGDWRQSKLIFLDVGDWVDEGIVAPCRLEAEKLLSSSSSIQ